MSTPVCVIAGVGPGNGAAFARKFAREGYRVALLARSSTTTGPLEKELPGSRAYSVDLTSPDAVHAAFTAIERDLGPADVFIHNATNYARGALMDTKPEDFEATWRSGAFSFFLSGQEAARQMLPRGGGSILAIGATASLRGGPAFAAFASSKAAHRSLAQSMARGLGPQGIHVAYVILDGAVDGRMRQMLPDLPASAFIQPDAVADTLFHLARQPRTAWTFELDLRTATETW